MRCWPARLLSPDEARGLRLHTLRGTAHLLGLAHPLMACTLFPAGAIHACLYSKTHDCMHCNILLDNALADHGPVACRAGIGMHGGGVAAPRPDGMALAW